MLNLTNTELTDAILNANKRVSHANIQNKLSKLI